jgi:hypothetical protein
MGKVDIKEIVWVLLSGLDTSSVSYLHARDVDVALPTQREGDVSGIEVAMEPPRNIRRIRPLGLGVPFSSIPRPRTPNPADLVLVFSDEEVTHSDSDRTSQDSDASPLESPPRGVPNERVREVEDFSPPTVEISFSETQISFPETQVAGEVAPRNFGVSPLGSPPPGIPVRDAVIGVPHFDAIEVEDGKMHATFAAIYSHRRGACRWARRMVAGLLGKHPKVVHQRYGKNGTTLLHAAASSGNYQLIKFLVENGANPTLQTDTGFSPLYGALFNGHVQVARYLVSQGLSCGKELVGHPELVDHIDRRGRCEGLAAILLPLYEQHIGSPNGSIKEVDLAFIRAVDSDGNNWNSDTEDSDLEERDRGEYSDVEGSNSEEEEEEEDDNSDVESGNSDSEGEEE